MRFTTYLNNAKCMEWKINATQGILFSLLYEAPAWAKEEIIENKAYYFVSRNLILNELPMFFEKADTVYRNLKTLAEKGLIEYIKKGKKDLIRISEKGKTWNEIKKNNSEKNPSFEDNLEKNPTKLGKKSEKEPKNSEKNPTNNNTIYYKNTKDDVVNNNITTTQKETTKEIEQQQQVVAINLAKTELSKLCDNKFAIDTALLTHRYKIQTLYKYLGRDKFLETFEKIQESSYLREQAKNIGQFLNWLFSSKKENFLNVFNDVYADKDKNSVNSSNESVAYVEANENSFDFSMWEVD